MPRISDIQSLAETDVNIAGMLALFLLVLAIAALVYIWKRPTPKQSTDESEQANKLIDVLNLLVGKLDTLSDVEEKVDGLVVTVATLIKSANAGVDAQKEIVQILLTHINHDDDNRNKIGTLSDKVEIMNTDIDKIKDDLEAVKLSLDNIEKIIEGGVCIDADSKELLEGFIERMQLLDIKIATITQETETVKEPTKPETKAKDKPNEL